MTCGDNVLYYWWSETSLGSTLHPDTTQGGVVAHPKVTPLFYSVYLPSYRFMCEFDGIGLMI